MDMHSASSNERSEHGFDGCEAIRTLLQRDIQQRALEIVFSLSARTLGALAAKAVASTWKHKAIIQTCVSRHLHPMFFEDIIQFISCKSLARLAMTSTICRGYFRVLGRRILHILASEVSDGRCQQYPPALRRLKITLDIPVTFANQYETFFHGQDLNHLQILFIAFESVPRVSQLSDLHELLYDMLPSSLTVYIKFLERCSRTLVMYTGHIVSSLGNLSVVLLWRNAHLGRRYMGGSCVV